MNKSAAAVTAALILVTMAGIITKDEGAVETADAEEPPPKIERKKPTPKQMEPNVLGRAYVKNKDDKPRVSSNPSLPPRTETYEVTAYTAQCEGCIGITKTGIDVRHTIKHEGKRIVAVDPAVIPLGTTIELRLASGRVIEATAQDVGGAIKGRRLDLLVKDRPTARAFGRQDVEVRVLKTKEGDGD